jgi:hypothetical protein
MAVVERALEIGDARNGKGGVPRGSIYTPQLREQ